MEEENFDYLVMVTATKIFFYEELRRINPHIKIVLWSHNYFNSHIAKEISTIPQIVANVFVSKQMYDFYFDNDVVAKSSYIFNPVVDRTIKQQRKYEPFSAVYMGCLIEEKGILDLLKIWKIVLSKYPQATLNIIGKGNLYDGRAKLGNLGITNENLEAKMKPYICDDDGHIKENYQFLGILGAEKYDVFNSCAVGIVNPSAKTETFGLGIIEMATMGLPVVTKCWNAHCDTIVDGKTGLMALTHEGMSKCIMRLFEDEKLNRALGKNAKARMKEFDPSAIASKWFSLFESLKNTGSVVRGRISARLGGTIIRLSA